MSLRPINFPVWVDTSESLVQAYQNLKDVPRMAVDTESNSLYVYHEKVSLIQISSPQTDFIIDPLAIQDISILGELFGNEKQEKIFHASEYDILCLKRDFHFTFRNIFDTMIAARILGFTQVGLGFLLNKYFEIETNKKYQRANWGVRPLSQEMLQYAQMDTHYLFQLRDLLEKELISHQLADLAFEDFRNACAVQSHPNGNPNPTCWKIAGSTHIDSRQAAILNELCLFREHQAKKIDLPLFKVMPRELLLEVSLQKPATLEELQSCRHCTEKIVKRYGEGLLAAVAKGQTAPPLMRQRSSRPDDDFLARLDGLKEWRKNTAKQLKVESDIVLPRDMMEKIAAGSPSRLTDLKRLMAQSPVRYRKFGRSILSTLKKLENP